MKLFFVINPGSGIDSPNYKKIISDFFSKKQTEFELYELTKDCSPEKIKKAIEDSKSDRVVAVGGDGTLKLVAECLINSDTPIAIIPAGSANGMAKELNIPAAIDLALELAESGSTKKIHVIKINDEICIHLSDLGFNAYLVNKFDSLPQRGMWGYTKATWHALRNHKKMDIELTLENGNVKSRAAMVAIANATMYGSGLKINPNGKLNDDLFEIILVKDYSYLEILKMWFTNLRLNPKKIEVFQTSGITVRAKRKVDFQIDGEYIGKINSVKASIIKNAITLVLPNEDQNNSFL